MTRVNDLEATAIERRVIERRPNLQRRVAIEPPEVSAILMPRKVGAATRVLVHEKRAVQRDARGIHTRGHAPKNVVRDPRPENGIELELLDFAVSEGRALP